MALFDDLIPQAKAGGLFDDLVPAKRKRSMLSSALDAISTITDTAGEIIDNPRKFTRGLVEEYGDDIQRMREEDRIAARMAENAQRGRVGEATRTFDALAEIADDPNRIQNIIPQGVAGLAQTAVGIGGTAVDAAAGARNFIQRGLSAYSGRDALETDPTAGRLAAADLNDSIQNATNEVFPMPQAQRRLMARMGEADGFTGAMKAFIEEPTGAVQEAARQAAQFVPAVRAAGVVGGSGLVAAGQGGVQASQEFENEWRDGVIQKSPEFQELAAQLGESRAKMEMKAKRIALAQGLQGSVGAATAGITSALGFNPVDDLVAGAGTLQGLGKGLVKEMIGETLLEEPADVIAGNIAARKTGSDRSLMQGVPESMASAAILGGLTAGAIEAPRAVATGAKNIGRNVSKLRIAREIAERMAPTGDPDIDAGAKLADDAMAQAEAARPKQLVRSQEIDALLGGSSGSVRQGDVDLVSHEEGAGSLAGIDGRASVSGAGSDATRTGSFAPDQFGGTELAGELVNRPEPARFALRDLPDESVIVAGDPIVIRKMAAESGIEAQGMARLDGVRFPRESADAIRRVFVSEPVARPEDAIGSRGVTGIQTLGAEPGAVGTGTTGEVASEQASLDPPVSTPGQPALRDTTENGRQYIGWLRGEINAATAERGGQKLADLGEISGFWRGRPKGWDADRALATLDKAERGEPLTKAETNFMSYAREWMRTHADENSANANVMASDSRLESRDEVQDDILAGLQSVADTSPQQRASVVSLGADYTDQIREFKRARAAGQLDFDGLNRYAEMLEMDRETGKVGGRPIPGVGNKTSYVDALDAGRLQPVQAFLDADNFKAVNDKFGHDVGDEVIRAIGETLVEEFGAGNVWSRGGDEFLFQGMTEAEVSQRMERVRARMAKMKLRLTADDGTIYKQSGIGVSYGTGQSERAAEDRLKADKQARRAAGLRYERDESPDSWRVGAQPGGAGREASQGRSGEVTAPAAETPEQVTQSAPADIQDAAVPTSQTETAVGEPASFGRANSKSKASGVPGILADKFGDKFATRIMRQPWMNVVDSVEDLPPDVRKFITDDGSVTGFVRDGNVYIIAGAVAPSQIPGVVMHEVGAHFGLPRVVGEEKFGEILRQFKRNATKADKVNRAYERARRAATPAKDIDKEAFAYYVEENWNTKAKWIDRITDAAKSFLNRLGIPLSTLNASPTMLRDMAIAAAHKAAAKPLTARDILDDGAQKADGKHASSIDDRTLYSRTQNRTPEQEAALAKAGMPEDTRSLVQRGRDYIREQWDALKNMGGGNSVQRALDRFHRMSAIEQDLGVSPDRSAYISARLAAGLPSIIEGIMSFGAPRWDNGVLSVDPRTVGLLDALKPVADDINGWLGWMVGRRAKVLKDQGRENLMSDDDINALLSLADGREDRFEESALQYLRIKRAVLDVAEGAGLIDPESRKTWDSVEYIPFYRQDEEGDSIGPGTRLGLAGQTSGVRQLKGGSNALADPLGNIIRNFTKLIDASLKNNAMLQAVDEYGSAFFEKVGPDWSDEMVPMTQVKKVLLERGVPQNIIDSMPKDALSGLQKMWSMKPPKDDDVVRIMRNGKAEYYRVPDKELLRSLTSFKVPSTSAVVAPLKFFKQLLTAGVTSSPEFMARNYVRDSLSSWVIADDKFAVGWDSVKGVVSPLMDNKNLKEMMFSGSTFVGGHLYSVGSDEQAATALRRALREKGLRSNDIETFIESIARSPFTLWDKWQKIGSYIENANRVAIYENALKAGRSKKEAAYLARDLMDFSMHGDSAFVQFLSDVLPFFNARLQGLYKLYRAGGNKALRKALLMRAGTIAAGTMALMAWNMLVHGDGYDELEEWDKDAYWHIAPGTDRHIRVPKPFELGVIFAAVPERLARAVAYQATDGKEGDRPKQFMESMLAQLSGTLAMNPIPQAAMPILETWANKSFFTGRPIESMGDQQVMPDARSEWYTSDTAKLFSDAIGNMTGLSPKKIEHLWRGYTGTIGGYCLDAVDFLVRQIQGQPERPELAWSEMPLLKAFYRGDTEPKNTRYVTEYYELARLADQVSMTIKEFELAGEKDRAQAEEKKYGWLIGERVKSKQAKAGFMHKNVQMLNKTSRELSDIRKAINGVAVMPGFTDKQKRKRTEELTAKRNEIARSTVQFLRQRDK